MSSFRPQETAAGPSEPDAPAPRPDTIPAGVSDIPPWGAWTAPAAVAAGLGVWVVFSIIVGVAARAGGSSLTHPSPAVSLIGDLVFDVAFVGVALYFARLQTRVRPADFGFRTTRWGAAIGGVIAAAIGYYVITAVYANLLHLHGNEKLPKELGVSSSTAALVGATIFVCVVAPIVEEFFFRGFIFGALRQMHIGFAGLELGPWVAAVITGILFGLAHTGSASPRYLIPLGFLGFVLCLLRWRTRSLYPCIALHSINNALALGYAQLHWDGGAILLLVVGSLSVIAALTGPLARRAPVIA